MNSMHPVTQEEFNQYMESLGPWGEDSLVMAPVAVAVSGGADSMCLALLTSRWRKQVIAFIVDHQLRDESAKEALMTQQRLSSLGISSRILTVQGLNAGAAMEERARIERYRILLDACSDMGCIDLMLGHHAGDQAETVLMRIRAGSGKDGLAGMAKITELPKIRLIRPLLSVNPQRLRKTLQDEGVDWIEDPSNQDNRMQRNRLRKELSAHWNQSGTVPMLLHRSLEEGENRMVKDHRQGDLLAEYCEIRPEGFLLLHKQSMDERTLGACIRTISGSVYTPLQKSLQKLAKTMRPVTLNGVQIMPAGRLGKGWLMIREEAAMESALEIVPDIIWDHRFRAVIPESADYGGIRIGALGSAYKSFADRRGLPVSILKTLPSFWMGSRLLSVPHLGICLDPVVRDWQIIFQPKQSVTQSYLFSTVKIG